MKKRSSPAFHRLTLSNEAWQIFAKKAKKMSIAVPRNDGKVDVAVSFSFMDYLHSASYPRENLSDTFLRIHKQGVK